MDNTTFNLEVGRVISNALDSAGISTRQLSAYSGIANTTLNRKLAGGSSFTINELNRIASVVQMTASDILRNADSRAA